MGYYKHSSGCNIFWNVYQMINIVSTGFGLRFMRNEKNCSVMVRKCGQKYARLYVSLATLSEAIQ